MSETTLADLLVPAGIALVTTLFTTAAGWWWSARQKRRADEATLLADAYAAVLAYREFPFAVRRRNPAEPAEERVRLSEQMRQVQERIDHHLGWMEASLRSRSVTSAYSHLVGETRRLESLGLSDLWIVECKDHASALSRGLVHEFRGKVENVGASRGIMVARSGYQDGCHAVVQNTNIWLTTPARLHEDLQGRITIERLQHLLTFSPQSLPGAANRRRSSNASSVARYSAVRGRF